MKRFGFALSVLFVSLLSSRASGQAQTLFFEDFESGAPGWTMESATFDCSCQDCLCPIVMWHVSTDGECGAVTRMGAYNLAPTACNYRTLCGSPIDLCENMGS